MPSEFLPPWPRAATRIQTSDSGPAQIANGQPLIEFVRYDHANFLVATVPSAVVLMSYPASINSDRMQSEVA